MRSCWPGLIEEYAHDLTVLLGKDVARARVMLTNLLGVVTLRPEKDGLGAEMRGNVHTLLGGTLILLQWCREEDFV